VQGGQGTLAVSDICQIEGKVNNNIALDPRQQAKAMGCRLSNEDLKNVSQEEAGHLIWKESKRKKDSKKYMVKNLVVHDPWGEGERVDTKEIYIADVHGDGQNKENVSIIDLRANYSLLRNVQNTKSDRKHSECQTDPDDGVDFDWDLSDKTDSETQVILVVIRD
jgi:hypothetical protein